MSYENSLKKGFAIKSRKYLLVVIVISALVLGVSFAFVSVVHVNATASSEPQMVGSQWAVYEQNTLPNGALHFYPASHADTIAGGGVEFSMPDATTLPSPTYVNYLLNTFTTSLTMSNTITATINVVTTCTSPVLVTPCPTAFVGNPDGGNPAVSYVRLFIQANLPEDGSANCGVGHKNILNYWWAVGSMSSYTFVPGGTTATVTLTASLDPTNWSGICGNSAALNPTGFSSALSDIKYVGLSFGSGSFFANGMGVDGSTGMATFQLLSYTV
jgi:hypothetical protein